jgi:hypothetical protein
MCRITLSKPAAHRSSNKDASMTLGTQTRNGSDRFPERSFEAAQESLEKIFVNMFTDYLS